MKRRTFIPFIVAGLIMLVSGSGPAYSAGKTGVSVPEKQVTAVEPQKKSAIKVTFVELGSVNCVPCKMMQPVMENIEKKYGDQVKVVFHDVWTKEGQVYGKQYKIRAIPTQVFLDKDGREYFRHTGFYPEEEIIKVLKRQGVK